jgi:hypothetical protein
MSASASTAIRFAEDVRGIRARHQSIHNEFGQQYLVAGCERGARTPHDTRRADILRPLVFIRSLGALSLGHDALDITWQSAEVRG